MHTKRIRDFSDWRCQARQAMAAGTDPRSFRFVEDNAQTSLFEEGEAESESSAAARPPGAAGTFSVPREFLTLAETVGYHRDPGRWNLLYRTLWRLVHEQSALLEISTDDDVLQIRKMEKEVRRDAHKMKAFVRFRKIVRDGEEHFIAWHRPDHYIVRKVAPFFSRRFKAMNWTILTPDESVVWNQQALQYGAGVARSEAPEFDELEELWKTYYANIFNPARIKIRMMKSEMPVRHWPTLPETEIIPDLLVDAPRRVEKMIAHHEGFAATARTVMERAAERGERPESLEALKQLAATCQACDLYQNATQVVFGTGPATARLVFVGEQPGDHEDIAGKPFVGPAGKIFDEALNAAGIDRDQVYITNVVKHFKNQPVATRRGKKRLHQRPDSREIRCCRPWLEAEWQWLPDAEVLVCLGATAATAIIGPNFRITRQRGRFVTSDFSSNTIATWHPSAILRTPDAVSKAVRLKQLTDDLQLAARRLAG